MRAGSLRHRLVVERPDVARDSSGDEVATWVTVASVWGSVEAMPTNEAAVANQIVGRAYSSIRVRWSAQLSGICDKWRMRHPSSVLGDTIYNILSVQHVRLGMRELALTVSEGVNDG